MWSFECSDETRASREAVWALWSDPERWAEFNPAIEWVRIDGEFAAGAKGKLKPRRGRASKIEIVSAEPQRGFASTGKLPFSRLHFEHELSEGEEGGTRITHRIRVGGPLGHIYAGHLNMDRNEVAVVANIARMAEEVPQPQRA
jgi:uncharacterized protein YndB with AHSA1/START domain